MLIVLRKSGDICCHTTMVMGYREMCRGSRGVCYRITVKTARCKTLGCNLRVVMSRWRLIYRRMLTLTKPQ